MLDGDILCPMKGMGHAYGAATVQPVFIIQANFVRGGLLLCFASQHNALDMNGQGVMIRQFAAAARGEPFDPEYVAAAIQDADTVVPLLKEGEVALGHEELRKPSSLTADGAPPAGEPGLAPWIYFRFPQEKLVELKKLASAGSTWVSTNDALTAFYLQRLTAVRIASGRLDRAEVVRCLRAVDGRRVLKPRVHEGYPGHLVGLATTELTAGDVLEGPLSSVASKIRQSVMTVDDHYIRSLATLIQNTEDKTTIFYAARMRPGKDILISSWAQMDLATCAFGPLLGTPDFVRRPRLVEVPQLAYVMPKTKHGDMDLGACLPRDDFSALEKDIEWKKYTQLIG
jgi:hypothetical protein